jgi:hypothetical protein
MVAVILLAPAGIVGSLRGALARRRTNTRSTSPKGTAA